VFCFDIYSQNDILERDSLPVFIVVDEDIISFLDSFIADAQHSSSYPFVVFIMYIDLYDNGNLSLILDLRKQEMHTDSIILYKPSCFYQAFVLHQNILFQVNFMSYFDVTNYYKLAKMLEKQPIKQCVYFKKPPSNFYDTNRKGEIDYEDMLMTWGYDYFNGEWQDVIKINYIEDD
jgi:hypothetical protein